MSILTNYNSKIEKCVFDGNYINFVFDEMKNRNILVEEENVKLAEKFQKVFTENIEYFFYNLDIPMLFSEKEMQIIFENFMYITGFYMYENIDDIFVCKSYIEEFSKDKFDAAVKFYESKVNYMINSLEEINKNNTVELAVVKYYLSKIIEGAKKFNINVVFDTNIDKIEEMSIEDGLPKINTEHKLPTDLVIFSLVERKLGLYGNLLAIEEIKAQFEIFSKFDGKRIEEIYSGIPFDYDPSGKAVFWNNLISPVFLQVVFCSEYSEQSIYDLKMSKIEFDVMIREAYTKLSSYEGIKEKFYIVKGSISKMTEHLIANLKNLECDMKIIYDITSFIGSFNKNSNFSDMIEKNVVRADREMNEILKNDLTTSQRKYIENFFKRIKKNVEERKTVDQLIMNEKFENMLREDFINSKFFSEFSPYTKEYIKKKIPNISNILIKYFKQKKNLLCFVD